jgi:hypothetical protein
MARRDGLTFIEELVFENGAVYRGKPIFQVYDNFILCLGYLNDN